MGNRNEVKWAKNNQKPTICFGQYQDKFSVTHGKITKTQLKFEII